jgi:hypothetical protein
MFSGPQEGLRVTLDPPAGFTAIRKLKAATASSNHFAQAVNEYVPTDGAC